MPLINGLGETALDKNTRDLLYQAGRKVSLQNDVNIICSLGAKDLSLFSSFSLAGFWNISGETRICWRNIEAYLMKNHFNLPVRIEFTRKNVWGDYSKS